MAKPKLQKFRSDIRAHYITDEGAAVHKLINDLDLTEDVRDRIVDQAVTLVEELRRADSPGVMETFLGEYGLTTEEGVALMCLAEALLRVPDEITMDALISDKIAPADWSKHLGHSSSPLVNASTWGLMLTGKVVHPLGDGTLDVVGQLRKLVKRVGEPVIRTAVSQSMKILGHQFVLGRDIREAMNRARGMEKKGYSYSYDMLGEAARTAEDAQRYFMAYSKAISSISEHSQQSDIRKNPGISVKLSALHPRYEYTQKQRVLDELVPRLSSLVFQAKNANMGFNIDAEEADRLDLSLDIIEAVLANPDLKGWDGFGVVVQAYGPRASYVLDWLYALSKKLNRKIMVRLVKGAYWDTEIKLAQVMGYEGYPVFTRKAATDVSYLACAKKLLSMTDHIYPQFATHNAHSIAAVLEMAGDEDNFEFQRLHGMGEGLHDLVMARHKNRCRIYAPVGVHEDLLAYLVRRLLENGANSSFVNQVLDEKVPPRQVVRDPVSAILAYPTIENDKIPKPADMYGKSRRNSAGINFSNPSVLTEFEDARNGFKGATWQAAPLIGGKPVSGVGQIVRNPSHRSDSVGTVIEATRQDVEQAVSIAVADADTWRQTPVDDRAEMLERIADLYEENRVELMALLAREAGKSIMDGISEVREAADFCRYYAMRVREDAKTKKGDQEGRGLFICISPWNFPLAIFTGQIVAALVAGNMVIAKPAEQTPLIAARAVELMHRAGIPGNVLQFLPGDGAVVGAALVSHPDIQGVSFTGSTETAQRIARAMAENATPEAPLIAETGGLNAMIVDSSALPEQAVRDIVASAFQSAGQRCSALRVLYVQEDVADKVIHMLEGAMAELKIGNPWDICVDVGPVIDVEAKSAIDAHCKKLEADGRLIRKLSQPSQAKAGCFVSPAVYRINGIEELEKEIFGPVLHVATFKADEVNEIVEKINATGYGLTLGLHTRVDTRVQDVCDRAHVGNLYVNRNQIGAVVGVQPFGGEGLSGTGPKAGGPLYLRRFMRKKGQAVEAPAQAAGKWTKASVSGELQSTMRELEKTQTRWDQREDRRKVLEKVSSKLDKSLQEIVRAALDQVEDYHRGPVDLVGPTGESNRLSLHGRGIILCAGSDAISMSAIALLTGNSVLLADAPAESERLIKTFVGEKELKGLIQCLGEKLTPGLVAALPSVDGISLSVGEYDLRSYRQALAAREGAIIPLIVSGEEWEAYVAERALCIDTTASGGNTKLLAANEA